MRSELRQSFCWRGLLLTVLAAGCLVACAPGDPDVLEVSRLEFRQGFDESYLTEYDPADWTPVAIPTNFSRRDDFAGYTGWVTLRLEVPARFNRHLQEGHPLALNAGRLLDVSRMYINSEPFGAMGSVTPYAEAAMRPFLRDIPFRQIRTGPGEINVVTIALYNTGKYPLEVMDQMELGLSDRVFRRHLYDEITSFGLLMLYLASGLYHLLLFVRRPRDRYNLFFAAFAVLLSLYWFVANTTTRDYFFADHVELHRRLEHMILFSLPALFVNFLSQFFYGRYTRPGIIYAVLSVWAILLTAFGDLWVMRVCRDTFYVLTAFALIYAIYRLIREILQGNRDARYLIIGILLMFGAVIHDVLAQKDIISSGRVANYTFLVFVGGLAGIMANRFMEITDRVEELNVHLEQEVEDRTRELQTTLEEVQRLKEHQDGDYFLTSLLLNPLAGNFSRSETVEIDLLTRQHKQFHFRKWDSEIGGDISIADTISLRGRDYTVFINADAMGKSMQGAGGALVLGTVFRSVLTRTRERAAMHSKSPEVWLRDCVFELQGVFASFNGSMLISIVLGLVDNATGLVFFLNAEHPWVVLYREGSARFIEDESYLRKVGVPGLHEDFRLRLFSLAPGDVLLAGSDGRDDIVLPDANDLAGAPRIINEDHTLFLRRVEDGRGELPRIEEELRRSGKFSDDLSLLRIAYRRGELSDQAEIPASVQGPLQAARRALQNSQAGPGPALESAIADVAAASSALQRETQIGPLAHAHTISALTALNLQLAIKSRSRAKIRAACAAAASYVGADNQVLYLQARAARLCGDLAAGLDAAERLDLRHPDHGRNLANLVELYHQAGDPSRARLTLNRLETHCAGLSEADRMRTVESLRLARLRTLLG